MSYHTQTKMAALTGAELRKIAGRYERDETDDGQVWLRRGRKIDKNWVKLGGGEPPFWGRRWWAAAEIERRRREREERREGV